ncbi:MAG: hypothetical protein WCP96_18595 [Methylococcaceae bacterium]
MAANGSAIDVYHTSCFNWGAAAVLAGGTAPGESTAAAKRFVAGAWHACTTNNAACTP